ncbi:hypothetical protein PSV08DRAFT_173340 [Bipolaris maydis]|uniref:uncharacterized protein n=1 Tax=Cochliobolus heterostrophus TaxID=5016 RepID=UPI0024DB8CD0|nr:hypothetical protein J3E73DRAFT_178597 [Bipolaris maydis]KAJ6273769.1 hypothetical protein PSV08DRAFT_173340 [Bipolaris maydis]
MVERLSKYNLINTTVSTLHRKKSTIPNDPHARPISRRMRHRRLFWIEICWRLMATLVFSITMIAVLHCFSLKGVLSRWEKRWFSALAILLSSMVSLSTGSLLGLLGSMIRWPLLARKLYTPVDADLILGIPNPTGAVKLIWIHTVQKQRWCVTTVIVMIYLLANITGRLSVAAFGLTFDLNKEPRIEYPIKIANWGTDDWFDDSALSRDYEISDSAAFDLIYQNLRLSNMPDDGFNFRNSSTYNMENIGGHGLNRAVEGDSVTYSYYLKQYRDEEITSSNASVVHSSSRCFGGTVSLRENQEMLQLIYLGDVTYEATFENILKKILSVYTVAQDHIIWIAPVDHFELHGDSGCATTYLFVEVDVIFQFEGYRNAILFECHTCTSHNNSIPGLGLLESSYSTTYNVSSLLHRVGYDEDMWGGIEEDNSMYGFRVYSGMSSGGHFANGLSGVFVQGNQLPFNATDGITFQGKLHPAHLAARLPLLAILGAEALLPKVTQAPGTPEQLFIDVRLKVKLKESITVLVCIFGGQILAISVVLFYCRNVFIRDYTSSLSVARLLKTTMEDVEGMSTSTGEELAEYLESKGRRDVRGRSVERC